MANKYLKKNQDDDTKPDLIKPLLSDQKQLPQKNVCIEDFDHSTRHLDTREIYRNIDRDVAHQFVKALAEGFEENPDKWNTKKVYGQSLQGLKRIFKIAPNHVQINYAYRQLIEAGEIEPNGDMEQMISYKNARHNSGVCVIALLTGPGKFSCPMDCHYCPDEPGQPRSYLSKEPAVIRANDNHFDACSQFWNRATTLALEGHPVDKIELLVLGGTWSNYPLDYQEEFIRDLYYAGNQFYVDKDKRRKRLSLDNEIKLNQDTLCRIIGITLETRPDFITKAELRRFRRYNITRVQIGIQHTDDDILRYINRGCYTKHTIKAIRLLKNNGFKIDIHLMPDLPGSTIYKDKKMFDRVLDDPDLQADQWKIYPCEVTPFSEIEKWFNEGKYKPYEDDDLLELILSVKPKVHCWIRLNRIIRDIPNTQILGGNSKTNLRQDIQCIMKQRGTKCLCIRCREVRQKKDALDTAKDAVLVRRNYKASHGNEVFLSFETADHETIYGFLRLRFPGKDNNDMIFKELQHSTAFVRELHVYGMMVPTKQRDKLVGLGQFGKLAQSMGFGKRLMLEAERITYQEGYNQLAVISGVGVRRYYQKMGYKLSQTYMVKGMEPPKQKSVELIQLNTSTTQISNYHQEFEITHLPIANDRFNLILLMILTSIVFIFLVGRLFSKVMSIIINQSMNILE